MAAPTHPPQSQSDYHYYALTIAVVAILVILSNVIAFACCSPCGFVESLRRLFRRPEVSTGGTNDAKPAKVIPALKYHDEENASDGGCSVCLSPFLDGEYIRQLPPCEHTFHAPCVPVRTPRSPTAAAGVDTGPQRDIMVSIVGDLV